MRKITFSTILIFVIIFATFSFTRCVRETMYVHHEVSLVAFPTTGVALMGAGEYNYKTSVTISATDTSDLGLIFDGWHKNKTDKIPVSQNNPYKFAITETITLFAKFSIPENSYIVEVNVVPTEAVESFSQVRRYKQGDEATVSITPIDGYKFLGWYRKGENEPVSNDFNYKFIIDDAISINQIIHLTARFSPPNGKYIVSLNAEPRDAAKAFVGARVYDIDELATVGVIPNDAYKFLGWYKDGNEQVLSTAFEYTFSITDSIAEDQCIKLTARFTPPAGKYIVEISADPENAAKALIGDDVYEKGVQASISIFTNETHRFVAWYREGEDEAISTKQEYSFTIDDAIAVNQKIKFIAKCVPTVLVELDADPSEAVKALTGADIYDEGENATINIVPNEGYTFLGWYKEGESKPIFTDAECTFTVTESLAVGNKITLIAKFSVIPLKKYMVELKADPTQAANTIIGAQEYTEGEEARVVVIPNSGYKFLGWYAEGGTKPLSTEFEYKFIVKESMATGSKILLTAKFIKEYTVSLVAEPAQAAQSLTGAG
ncbi:MAG: InlB B-repeat-containing protein, partial [Bacteroidales bacterium]